MPFRPAEIPAGLVDTATSRRPCTVVIAVAPHPPVPQRPLRAAPLALVRFPNYIAGVPDSLALDLTLACSRFARLAARRTDVGVSSVTWRVASFLERGGAARISDIAAFENVSRPTATAVVQRLEQEGMVTREADPQDQRSFLISLSDHGRGVLAEWRGRLAVQGGQMLGELSADDRAALARATRILEDVLHAADPVPRS